MKVQPIYNSKILKKTLEFASDHTALFTASASFALSTIIRPAVILATPKTDKENKQYAFTKSLASNAVGYLLMLIASLPISNAIKNIDKSPEKYLKANTIKNLQGSSKTLCGSKRYQFATQLFKLGLGILIAVPKSILTCSMIPPLMSKIFKKKPENSHNDISFTGNPISKGLGKIIDTKAVQKMSKKFHNTNFELHMMSLTDSLATTAFMVSASNSKKIKEERKKALIYNAGISTCLSITGGYILDKILKKPTEKFIKNFTEANKNSPKLDKWLEGIRILKPVLILGTIYYVFIPLISTFMADRFSKKSKSDGAGKLY